MTVDLIRKRRVGRVLRITVPSGQFVVEYNGYGLAGESVLVDGQVVTRKTSWTRMVPRFEFAVGPHRGVIEIRTKLWRDLLGPILGTLESFSLTIDGQEIYHDVRTPTSRLLLVSSLAALAVTAVAGIIVLSSTLAPRSRCDIGYRPAPPNAWVLDVPYVPQESGTDCFPACLAMVLRYHQVPFDRSRLDAEVAIGTTGGSHMHRVLTYLGKLRAGPVLSYPRDVTDVVKMVRRGFPVFVPQELTDGVHRSVHAVVVVGVAQADGGLVLHDPFYGQGVSLDKETFDLRWLKGGGYTRMALILRAMQPAQLDDLPLVDAQIAGGFEEGRFHVESGDTGKAITAFQTTVLTAPEFIPGYLWLGSCLAQEDRHEEALEILHKALELDESYYWGIARVKLASGQLLVGKAHQAKVNFEKFLAAEPMELPHEVRVAHVALAALERQSESASP